MENFLGFHTKRILSTEIQSFQSRADNNICVHDQEQTDFSQFGTRPG